MLNHTVAGGMTSGYSEHVVSFLKKCERAHDGEKPETKVKVSTGARGNTAKRILRSVGRA